MTKFITASKVTAYQYIHVNTTGKFNYKMSGISIYTYGAGKSSDSRYKVNRNNSRLRTNYIDISSIMRQIQDMISNMIT